MKRCAFLLCTLIACSKEAPKVAAPERPVSEPTFAEPEEAATNSDFTLSLDPGDALEITLANHTDQPMKIFEFWNSWGWSTLSLELRIAGEPGTFAIARNNSMVWTRNFPSVLTIEPGQQVVLPITPGDESWVATQDPSSLATSALEVRAVLRIDHGEEAAKQNVFIGEISSEWTPISGGDAWLQQDMRVVPIL